LNAFEDHAAMLAQYEGEKVSASEAVVRGSVFYLGKTIPAIVEPFSIQNFLNAESGGLTTRVVSSAMIRKAAVPAGVEFASLANISVRDPQGTDHDCQINEMEDMFTVWRLVVVDKNQMG